MPDDRVTAALDRLPFVYSWGPRGNMPGSMSRKGERCRVLVRGGKNSCLVEFADGYWAVVSRYAIRRAVGPKER